MTNKFCVGERNATGSLIEALRSADVVVVVVIVVAEFESPDRTMTPSYLGKASLGSQLSVSPVTIFNEKSVMKRYYKLPFLLESHVSCVEHSDVMMTS